jgi:DNA-binding HxlR family transcriptional regulator
MGNAYHQFCPVAKAMELLDERWTMLVVRELMSGSTRFNELRRGVPRMNPTLLSKRLHQLVRAGLVERHADGSDVRYLLTDAGLELQAVVEALGTWGIRWIGNLGDEDLDPKLLLWDMHRRINLEDVPSGRTVIEFRFSDVAASARTWWLVLTREAADVRDSDPGHQVDVSVKGTLRALTRVWRGDVRWGDALRSGDLEIEGRQALRRAFPAWFALSAFAVVPRPAVAGTATGRGWPSPQAGGSTGRR